MRNLLLRLRHWTIKKLGGYTEQYVHLSRNDYHVTRINPCSIVSEVRVDPYFIVNSRGNEQICYEEVKRRLAGELASRIVKMNFFRIICKEEPENFTRVYRASLLIVPPHEEAFISINKGGETS
ncbi:MAG: hypothetical protein RR336_06600 [Oscillospiraceae bacterium]